MTESMKKKERFLGKGCCKSMDGQQP